MRKGSGAADPTAITRAMLEGALHKANDAVTADKTEDWDYAVQAYADSCALLERAMERTDQRTEVGKGHWTTMFSIRTSYIKRLHSIRETYLAPRTPRSTATSRPRTPRSGATSARSSTYRRTQTPPRTPRQMQTPPMTPPFTAECWRNGRRGWENGVTSCG